MNPVLLVSGTGTGIGKTHLAQSLLLALRKRCTMVGWKPVESGVSSGDLGDDQALLTSASTPGAPVPGRAHVALASGVSPHLAAERAQVDLPWDVWVRFARSFAASKSGLLVELAGGLFSPLSLAHDNADLVLRLRSDALESAKLLLCAPDRLGVLTEIHSALLAAAHLGVRVDAVVLMAPSEPDASTGTNRRELERTLARAHTRARANAPSPTIFGPMPRMSVSDLSEHAPIEELADFSF